MSAEDIRSKINRITTISILFLFSGILSIVFAPSAKTAGADDFIITVKTDNTGISNDNQVILPFNGNYSVDWNNDGVADETGSVGIEGLLHTFPSAGTYTIRIISFSNFSPHWYEGGDRLKYISIDQWGTHSWNSLHYMFNECSNLDIAATDNGNFGSVTTMAGAFRRTASVSGDISGWDVSSVTDMGSMFSEITSFNQDISGWNVSNVTDMNHMFHAAEAFNQPIGGWDVSKVTDMSSMFLEVVDFNQDISGWDVSNVTNMWNMFRGPGGWGTRLAFDQDISSWDVSSVTNMSGMFASSRFNHNIDSWNVSNVTDMSYMFGMNTVYNQPMNSWDVSKVTDMSIMFYAPATTCVFNQDLNNWDVSSVTDMSSMFSGANAFDGNISSWNVSNVTDMSYMFHDARYFNQDITGWNVSSVTSMRGMFGQYSYGAETFNQDISGWNVSNVTDMSYMFQGAESFNQPIGVWNVSNVTNMAYMFYGADVFNNDISSWDVSKVTNMSNMFRGTWDFNQDIGSWNVSSVTDMSSMFESAYGFNQDLGSWNVGNVTNMSNMFSHAASNYDLSGWDVSKVTNMSGMFYYSSFNNDSINGWNVSNVTDFSNMFFITYSRDFLFDLHNWNISKATNMLDMFGDDSEIAYYDQVLSTWSQLSLQSGLTADFGKTTYCNSETARSNIISSKSWTIVDGGKSCPFLSVWKTDNEGATASNQVRIPDYSDLTYNYSIDWNGDGTKDQEDLSWSWTHTYDQPGTYTIGIYGTFPGINFGTGTSDRLKILSIDSWGDIAFERMDYAFYNASNLDITATDILDTSAVTSMYGAFWGIGGISGDISGWDTRNVQTFGYTFSNIPSFNQDITNWDVSSAIQMSTMFYNTPSFDRDISGWDVSNVTTMSYMFHGAGLSTDNYDALLNSWSLLDLQNSVSFDAGSSVYCAGEPGRQSMIDNDSWVITDAGKSCPVGPDDAFVITVKTDNVSSRGWDVSESNQFTISTRSSNYTYNYNVDWDGDGTIDDYNITGDFTHTYPTAGTYTVKISGIFPGIYNSYNTDAPKIIAINQWGSNQWKTMYHALAYTENLEYLATDIPDLSGLTSLQWMFRDSPINADLSSWDVSNISDFSYMFYYATNFDQDLSSWDVSSATNMASMFRGGGLSVDNYDALLIGWEDQILQSGVSFDAGASSYCAGENARASMIANDSWTIADAGKWCEPADAEYYHAIDYGGAYARLELKYGHEDSASTITAVNIPTGYTFYGTAGLAYDPTDCEVYTLIKLENIDDGSWQNFFLATLDLETKEATIIGNTGESVSNIFFNEDGDLFGVTGGYDAPGNIHSFVSIDKTTGVASLIQTMGEGTELSDNYGHTVAYSPNESKALYLHGYNLDRVFQSINLDGSNLVDITYAEDDTTPSEAPTVLYYDINVTDKFILMDWSENIYEIDSSGNETLRGNINGYIVNDVKGLIPWSCPYVLVTPTPTPTPTPTDTPIDTPTDTPTGTPTVTVTTPPPTSDTPTPTVTDTITPSFITGTPTDTILPTYFNNSCPRFKQLDLSKEFIKEGDTQTITWESEGADSVTFNGSIVPLSGQVSFPVNKEVEIRFVAQNKYCSTEEDLAYSIVDFYPTEVLPVAAASVLIGETILLQFASLYGSAGIGSGTGQYGSLLGNIWLLLAGMIKNKKKKQWGVVFDSSNNKPISRAILRLYDKTTNKIVQTAVSDAYGLFTLKPDKGVYILKVSHPKYSFPSKLDINSLSNTYASPYVGGILEITEDNKELGISIPLDTKEMTSAEVTKLRIQSILENTTVGISTSLLIAGLIYSVYVLTVAATFLNYSIVGVYLILAAIKSYYTFIKPKTEGKVTDKATKKPVKGLEIGLFDEEYERLIYRTFTSDNGTYSFAVGEGKYKIRLMDESYKLFKSGKVVKEILIDKKHSEKGHIVADDLLVISNKS